VQKNDNLPFSHLFSPVISVRGASTACRATGTNEIDHMPGGIDHMPGRIDHMPSGSDYVPSGIGSRPSGFEL